MAALATVPVAAQSADAVDLPTLVDRAAQALAEARDSAEVLEARDLAALAYDAAKRAARLHRAKDAHDTLIAAAHRAQAHALQIEAQAKHRLADEYDAAQARGEVASGGRPKTLPDGKGLQPTAAALGLSYKDIHDARAIRDAERAEPGLVRRVLDDRLARGAEPTRAVLRRAAEARLGRSMARLKAAEAQRARVEAMPKAPPPSADERARQAAVFGTQEDRAICARIDEIVELVAEQPDPAEAVRRIPPASRHAIRTAPIRAAAAWLEAFCTTFEKEHADGRQTTE